MNTQMCRALRSFHHQDTSSADAKYKSLRMAEGVTMELDVDDPAVRELLAPVNAAGAKLKPLLEILPEPKKATAQEPDAEVEAGEGEAAGQEAEADSAEDGRPDAVDVDSLRKEQLVELCEEAGIDATGTKADLIDRLKQAGY